MIAAASSGSGKTMITCGLLELFKRKGLNPLACKCGPDYIDGLFHKQVLELEGMNLDSYFEDPKRLRDKYVRRSWGHLPVVEGVMGYFDGLGGSTTRASSWEIAHILELPAVLVVDAKGASVSLAAVVKGFLEFERPKGSRIKAVIFNRMPPMLYPRIRELVERETGIRAAGFVPELDFLKVGSRHLGLVLPEEIAGLREQMNRLGKCLEETIDWKFLAELGAETEKEKRDALKLQKEMASCAPAHRFRLGIAMDEAFCFYYQDNLRLLECLGGELVYFSPLHDRNLPGHLDGLIFGGGYPELYSEVLSRNQSMREAVKRAAEAGLPVLGECGGYLYLLEELEGADGCIRPMTGVLKGKGYKKGKNGRFGYIEVETEKDSLYLKPGEQIRGHEFHYWDCETEEGVMRAKKPVGNRSWPCIRIKKQVMAGFPHLFYPSCPEFASRFAKACVEYRQKRDETEG